MKISTLAHILDGNCALARINEHGLKAGDTVYVNTNTAPTPTGRHIMYATVKSVGKEDFTTHEVEPYFGYNVFKHSDILG